MKRYSFSNNKRMAVVKLFIAAVFIFAVYKLVDVQVINGPRYKAGALEQTTKNINLTSERGDIQDITGKKLAVNIKGYTPWVIVNELDEEADIPAISESLSGILEMDTDQLTDRISSAESSFKITQWIDKEQAELIKDLKYKGIRVEESVRRYYPYGDTASYIIGFTDIDNRGIEGIENTYSSELSGRTGRIVSKTDISNNPLPFYKETEFSSSDGLTVVSTIDVDLQLVCEDVLEKNVKDMSAIGGYVLCMEAKTGKIKAMAMTPTYDLNKAREPRNDEEKIKWEALDNEALLEEWYGVWRNNNISNAYEPGSTFKIVTTAIGLEEGVCSLNKYYLCNGIYRDIKGVQLRCINFDDPHGTISLMEGFIESCNIYFIRLGMDIGREKYYDYIKAFGFGEKTGIELNGESEGIIPLEENFKPVNLATMSYGHGLSVTPIQMLTASAAIVNGGDLLEPIIVDKLINKDGVTVVKNEPVIRRKVLSKTTSDTVNVLMRETVAKGTGKRIDIPGYEIGGKTGTSVKFVNNKYSDDYTIASMIATVPAKDPEYVFLAIVDEPKTQYRSGGVVAGKILREILDQSLTILNVKKSTDQKEVQKVEMPDVIGMSSLDAGRLLSEMQIEFTTEYNQPTSTDYIIAQSVKAGTKINSGNIVVLTLGGNKERVAPDLVGLSRSEAVAELDKLGIPYEIGNVGIVVSQEPKAGEILNEDSKIIVELDDN